VTTSKLLICKQGIEIFIYSMSTAEGLLEILGIELSSKNIYKISKQQTYKGTSPPWPSNIP